MARRRGLAFECSSGRVVKVEDAICWRHAEGRACFLPHAGTRLPDVVVVPVAPTVREMEESGEAAAEAPAGLDLADATAYRTYGGRIWATLECVRVALTDAGLRVEVDTNVRLRASAKFAGWERRGATVRIEVGKAEAETGLLSIWVHKEYAHAAASAVADPHTVPPAAAVELLHRPAGAMEPGKLRGVPLTKAVVACCAVASLAKRASALSASFAPQVSLGRAGRTILAARFAQTPCADQRGSLCVPTRESLGENASYMAGEKNAPSAHKHSRFFCARRARFVAIVRVPPQTPKRTRTRTHAHWHRWQTW